MMSLTIDEKEFQRYLSLLGVSDAGPGIDVLKHLVSRHLTRVPFENISKLYYWKTMGIHASMDLTQYLDGIEKYHFGGTCYANAFHLNELLRYLGFDVRLCGADMAKPDVHIVNVVSLDGREYLVDVGYAAPFMEPVPLDLATNYTVGLGADLYVVKPRDQAGRTRVELYRNGSLRHGYLLNPRPRLIDEFAPVIAGSFAAQATFMNAILLVRFEETGSYVLHNKELIETNGAAVHRKPLSTADEVVDAIKAVFKMPHAIVRKALEGMSFEGDAWN